MNQPHGSPLPISDLVLAGAGHTHLHVVLKWLMQPIPGVRLTLVSPTGVATYSGMLPGVLAGNYPRHEMQIDLQRLVSGSDIRLILADATGADPQQRRLLLRDRSPLRFDVLSINVGSEPAGRELWENAPHVVCIKPMLTFLDRLHAACPAIPIDDFTERSDATTSPRVPDRSRAARPVRIAVVGAGAGGVEIACGLRQRLHRANLPAEITLVDAHAGLLRGYSARAQRLMQRWLERPGADGLPAIRVELGRRVTAVPNGAIHFVDGNSIACDVVIWAAGATAAAFLKNLPYAKDDRGFVAIRETLQSVSEPRVFAVGDSGSMIESPFPKAGVFAVRQGPVLWANLQKLFDRGRFVENATLQVYRPQRRFLSLLSLGNGTAIANYGSVGLLGTAAWWLKDQIDRAFMNKHRARYPTAVPPTSTPQPSTTPSSGMRTGNGSSRSTTPTIMRCTGCGGKVSSAVLQAALSRIEQPPGRWSSGDLRVAQDAVVLQPGCVDVLTTDFFAGFVADPELLGRLSVLHALSDLWARGAEPRGVLANVVLPAGSTTQQAELLFQILSGAVRELSQFGAELWGGHTIEGDALHIGFNAAGSLGGLPPFSKAGAAPGDQLLLTKPLGTGTLLAALRQGATTATSIEQLYATLLQPNAVAAQIARKHAASAVTDVTGFGLLGHLREMLEAGNETKLVGTDRNSEHNQTSHATVNQAQLKQRLCSTVLLDSIPLLPGFRELSALGWKSTLATANRESVKEILRFANRAVEQHPAFAAVFDPQTCGGLLLAVKPAAVDNVLRDLHAAGIAATRIGEFTLVTVNSVDEPGGIELR